MEEATTPIEPAAPQPEAAAEAAHGGAHPAHHQHGPPTSFIRKYIFSIDHKVIGIQYLLLAIFAAFLGMFMSVLMRLNLTWPGRKWALLETIFPLGAPGGVMSPEFYLSLVTMHGTMMVFFVLTTAPQGGFGNYFLPFRWARRTWLSRRSTCSPSG
jgi:cytochrome c oxidase subunit 1